jgi:hypothetical protein
VPVGAGSRAPYAPHPWSRYAPFAVLAGLALVLNVDYQRGRAEKHHHRLEGEWHRRKWQRNADLGRDRGENRHEQDRADLFGQPETIVRAGRHCVEECAVHERGS